MAKRKRSTWPSNKFLSTGPKLRSADLNTLNPWFMTDDLVSFLQWRNGGVPDDDSFEMDYEDAKIIARVREFFGFDTSRSGDVVDIPTIVFQRWHQLPRGCVPIGEIDIDGHDFDGCTLLTFLWGDRAGHVYFFDNPHDIGDLDPDDESRLILLAKSLPKFVRDLKQNQELQYHELYRIPGGPGTFSAIEKAFKKAGAKFGDGWNGDGEQQIERISVWKKHACTIHLISGISHLNGVDLPPEFPDSESYLGLGLLKGPDRSCRAEVKKLLGKLPEWKGVKCVSKFPRTNVPYWRK